MIKGPCQKTCPGRVAGCHAGIPRYAAWAAKRAEELEARRTDDPVQSYLKDASRRIAHRRHIKGR